jgi:hypothetical protein
VYLYPNVCYLFIFWQDCLYQLLLLQEASVNYQELKVIVDLQYVGYLSSGFEYFLSGFAQELVPIRPTLVPSRTRRALSIPLFTFPNRPLPHLAPLKCQKP